MINYSLRLPLPDGYNLYDVYDLIVKAYDNVDIEKIVSHADSFDTYTKHYDEFLHKFFTVENPFWITFTFESKLRLLKDRNGKFYIEYILGELDSYSCEEITVTSRKQLDAVKELVKIKYIFSEPELNADEYRLNYVIYNDFDMEYTIQ